MDDYKANSVSGFPKTQAKRFSTDPSKSDFSSNYNQDDTEEKLADVSTSRVAFWPEFF